MANLPAKATLRRGTPPPRSGATVSMLPVEGDPLSTIVGLKLPEGASLAVVSADIDILKSVRASSRARFGALRTMRTWSPEVRGDATGEVDRGAFEPSARSLAILRGRQLAADDLKIAGGAFTLEQVRTMMGGVSRQSVAKRVRDGSLLSVPGPSNRRSFPALQFAPDGTVTRGLRQVREALGTRNDWTLLNFLTRPDPRLDGRRPIELLNEGAVDEVLASARRVGQQGA